MPILEFVCLGRDDAFMSSRRTNLFAMSNNSGWVLDGVFISVTLLCGATPASPCSYIFGIDVS
jgi:hypothetical protein